MTGPLNTSTELSGVATDSAGTKKRAVSGRVFSQFSIKFLLTAILLLSGFLAGWSRDVSRSFHRKKLQTRELQMPPLPDDDRGRYLLKFGRKIRETVDAAELISGQVGVSIKVERSGNDTFLSIPLGSADGLSIGDLGVVLKNEEPSAVISVTQLQTDRCLTQVVQKIGGDRPVSFGDRVEFIVMEDFSLEWLKLEIENPQ